MAAAAVAPAVVIVNTAGVDAHTDAGAACRAALRGSVMHTDSPDDDDDGDMPVRAAAPSGHMTIQSIESALAGLLRAAAPGPAPVHAVQTPLRAPVAVRLPAVIPFTPEQRALTHWDPELCQTADAQRFFAQIALAALVQRPGARGRLCREGIHCRHGMRLLEGETLLKKRDGTTSEHALNYLHSATWYCLWMRIARGFRPELYKVGACHTIEHAADWRHFQRSCYFMHEGEPGYRCLVCLDAFATAVCDVCAARGIPNIVHGAHDPPLCPHPFQPLT